MKSRNRLWVLAVVLLYILIAVLLLVLKPFDLFFGSGVSIDPENPEGLEDVLISEERMEITELTVSKNGDSGTVYAAVRMPDYSRCLMEAYERAGGKDQSEEKQNRLFYKELMKILKKEEGDSVLVEVTTDSDDKETIMREALRVEMTEFLSELLEKEEWEFDDLLPESSPEP